MCVGVSRANFSIAEAFSSGVGVIERSYRSVFVWAAATFAVSLAPALLVFLLKGGQFSVPDEGRSLAALKGADAGVVINQFHRVLDGGYWVYLLLWLFWSTFGAAVLQAAVYRSVLEPKQERGAWLRIGGTEVWLFLLMIVQGLALAVLFLFWFLLIMIGALLAKIVGPPAGAWVAGVVTLASTVLAVWLIIRFSLSAAMTVGEGRFRFFSSWTLTKGRSWKLFWTFFLIVALARGLELFGAATVLILNGTALQPVPSFLIPFELVWLALVSLAIACLRTLFLAPLATAYRGLSAGAG
jgi:hypothetical protein